MNSVYSLMVGNLPIVSCGATLFSLMWTRGGLDTGGGRHGGSWYSSIRICGSPPLSGSLLRAPLLLDTVYRTFLPGGGRLPE